MNISKQIKSRHNHSIIKHMNQNRKGIMQQNKTNCEDPYVLGQNYDNDKIGYHEDENGELFYTCICGNTYDGNAQCDCYLMYEYIINQNE